MSTHLQLYDESQAAQRNTLDNIVLGGVGHNLYTIKQVTKFG